VVRAVQGSGRFGWATVYRHRVVHFYSCEQYLDLLRTMSDHATMPSPLRRRLFAGLRRAFAAHGGRYARPVIAALVVAPLKRTASA
jgi:hypothetical protein